MATSLNNQDQNIENQLNALLVDITAIRASILGITAKLDTAMAAVNNYGFIGGTSIAVSMGTNFASLWNPAALTATAGT